MSKNIHPPKMKVLKGVSASDVRQGFDNRDLVLPAPVETFDYEGMGIAAKE